MNSLNAHIRPPCRPLLRLLPLLLLMAAILLAVGQPASAADAPPPEGQAVAAATQPDSPPEAPQPEPPTVVTRPEPPPARADIRPTPSLAIATLKAFGALAVVLGLLVLFAAALKKLGLSGQSPHGDGLIKVLETRMLAPKKYVAILEIAGQTLAVGITDQQISLLTRLEPDENLLALARQRPPASRFASLLSGALNKNNIAQKDNA